MRIFKRLSVILKCVMAFRRNSYCTCCLGLVLVQLTGIPFTILFLHHRGISVATLFKPETEIADRRQYFNGDLNISAIPEQGEPCAEKFLELYSNYCQSAILPSVWILKQHLNFLGRLDKDICPCIPPKLRGQVTNLTLDDELWDEVRSGIVSGGHWSPSSCIPRQRVAIIVPYRDRYEHLQTFLKVMHAFLQNQLLQYSIFVAEQTEPRIFNKASLMNAAFVEIRSRKLGFDCFIFHDVDMLPIDDRNFYGCYKYPRHVGAYVDKFNFRLLYHRVFGGSTAFTQEQFEASNGYSNEFYGWGGEDDDMEKRVTAAKMDFLRFPRCISKYTMMRHRRDADNPHYAKAQSGWQYRPHIYKINGLNSLVYKLVIYDDLPLFTRIAIELPPPPTTPHLPPKPNTVKM